MAVPISLSLSKLHFLPNPKRTQLASTPKAPNFIFSARKKTHFLAPIISNSSQNLKYAATILGLSGLAFTTLMVGSASGSELAIMGSSSSSFQFSEPSNALSLHTWASHVSSVVEWVTAMALVWQYGEKSGYESWKGLAWGMVSSTKIRNLNLWILTYLYDMLSNREMLHSERWQKTCTCDVVC